MEFNIMTVFPNMMENILSESIIGRARKAGIITADIYNIRDYSDNKHSKTDDTPYGGGRGMVMMVQPITACFDAICEKYGHKPHCIYVSPKGKHFTQKRAEELSKLGEIVVLCGHYEGVDERALEMIVDEEISAGDYVLTGGELPAAIIVDAVSRLVPGVLPEECCYENDSISCGLLEYPQYTRPEIYDGRAVPEILLSGHHANIEKWRREQSLLLTAKLRPDMLASAPLTPADRKFLAKELPELVLSPEPCKSIGNIGKHK